MFPSVWFHHSGLRSLAHIGQVSMSHICLLAFVPFDVLFYSFLRSYTMNDVIACRQMSQDYSDRKHNYIEKYVIQSSILIYCLPPQVSMKGEDWSVDRISEEPASRPTDTSSYREARSPPKNDGLRAMLPPYPNSGLLSETCDFELWFSWERFIVDR